MKIGYKLIIGLLLAALSSILIAGLSYNLTSSSNNYFKDMEEKTIPDIEALEQMRFAVSRIMNSINELVLLRHIKDVSDTYIEDKQSLLASNLDLFDRSLSKYRDEAVHLPNRINYVHAITEERNKLKALQAGFRDKAINKLSDKKLLETKEHLDNTGNNALTVISAAIDHEKNELSELRGSLKSTIDKSLYIISIICAATFILALTGGRLLSNTISSRIEVLKDAAIKFGKGEFSAELNITSKDEIGSLADSLNIMRNDINAYQRLVEQKNAEMLETNLLLEKEVAERKKHEDQISYLAYYDPLTNLPNRFLFHDRFNEVIRRNERNSKSAAVLFLDIDNFKRINDTLGHNIGDDLLKKISVRIKEMLRKSDSVSRHHNSLLARLGGDEFTVLLSEIKEFEDAAKVAKRLIESLTQPFILGEHEIIASTSIGIAVYPNDGKDIDALMKNADSALHHAKKAGKNSYQYYKASMNVSAMEKLTLENELRKAIERNELVLYYQPQVDVREGKIIGMEALIRWQHPQKGQIPPLDFIPIAEQTGLIIPLSYWVMEAACKQYMEWKKAGIAVPISVNLSSVQFQQRDFIENLLQTMQKHGMDADGLMLEITEGTIMENTETSVINLTRLMDLNMKLIIDDFGTGYSSLSYLKRFPLYGIKLDRSFVREIGSNPDDTAIALAIISIARALKLDLVAEGVETEQQIDFLRNNNCNIMQGFYFSRPLPAQEVSGHLRNGIKDKGIYPAAVKSAELTVNTNPAVSLPSLCKKEAPRSQTS